MRDLTMADRAELVRRYGEDPIAFSTLQAGLRYCDTSYGYIAYQRAWGIDITLGPPIAAASDHAALIERFVRHSRRPIFCYLRASAAAHVQHVALSSCARSLHLAGMGVDRILDPATLAQPKIPLPKPLLGARKHAKRAGFSIEPVAIATLSSEQRERIAQITAAYLAHSQLPYEMRFLNRPFSLSASPSQPPSAITYLLHQQPTATAARQLLGYAVLNPWFRAGQVAGYLLDILRCQPTRQWGVYYALIDALGRELFRQGIGELSLGFCPLHRSAGPETLAALGGTPAQLSASLSFQVDWLERHLAAVPYVQRLRELKDGLPGRSEPRYFVSYTQLVLPAFVALLSACGVALHSIIGPKLWQSIVAGRRS